MSAFNLNRTQTLSFDNLTAFTFSPSLLNEALANITISAISLNKWHDLVNASATRAFNVYRFEHYLSFYLPYGLSLLFMLPVALVGLRALQHNDVTAIDGGFVQILMTTTGRTEIENAAVKGCLGGEENIPKALKKLKIRFGELVVEEEHSVRGDLTASDNHEQTVQDQASAMQDAHGQECSEAVLRDNLRVSDASLVTESAISRNRGTIVRRAGFGLVDETIPLMKGVVYG